MAVWNLLLCGLLILLLLHKLILRYCRRATFFSCPPDFIPRPSAVVHLPPVLNSRPPGFYRLPRLNIRFDQGGSLVTFLSKLPSPKKSTDQGGLLVTLLSKLRSPKKSTKPSRDQLKKAKRRARKARNRAHVNPKSANPQADSNHVSPKTVNSSPKNDSTSNVNTKASIQRAGLFRPELHGIDIYEKKLMEFLEHGTTPLIGIVGIRGVGKTTLLKLMRTYYNQLPYFRYIFFVEAGKDFTIDMLSGIVSRDIGFGPIPVVDHICSFLRTESFLLLLDDLQCAVDLADAGLPIELGPQQKIVFTTRDEAVLVEMGCAGSTFRMHCLDEVTAWNLFVYLVGDKIINYHPDIKDLAKKMVAECHGIPGALYTLGGLMSTKKNLESWIVAHELLDKSQSHCEIEETENEGYPCLQFLKDEI